MKKAISILLLLCLLAGISCPAAAEEDGKILDFPKSGVTFTVPDFMDSRRNPAPGSVLRRLIMMAAL